MTEDELYHHDCGGERRAAYDAKGIFLTYVCDECEKTKLAKYRPEVLTDSGYQCDEQVEEEQR